MALLFFSYYFLLSLFLVILFFTSSHQLSFRDVASLNRNMSFSQGFVAFPPILQKVPSLNRTSFPQGFIFGAASSAYQFEGAATEDYGKGPSIWDTFTHQHPEKIEDRSNADVATDQYHRYKEDVEIMKDMNLDSYKFSISWSRILPKGNIRGGINHEGITYYHNVIDELKSHGIEPFVTLFHWDLPQGLEDEYGGFLSNHIADDFRDFANLCFYEFGRKVKYWSTMHEPVMYSAAGYALGIAAPGRCSEWLDQNCFGGDSGTEPYNVTHNLILAHAAAVHLYRTNYQAHQKGLIGVTLTSNWYEPLTENNINDQHAAKRILDFQYGWFMEPIATGYYPKIMRALVGSRLPTFTAEESKLIIGSFDFVGLNYYFTSYAYPAPNLNTGKPTYHKDPLALVDAEFVVVQFDEAPLGQRAASNGLQELLIYTKNSYNNPLIFISLNGIVEYNHPTLSLEEALLDTQRIEYHYVHLFCLQSAIEEHGLNVRGYFAGSLLDAHEWSSGFTLRYGLTFVDYKNGLERHKKLSGLWYKNFLKRF